MESAVAEATLDKDQALREDIRLLGRLLGDTLREQEGAARFELVEAIRLSALAFRRDGDVAARAALEELLDQLGHDTAISVVRAFSFFSQLANIAEDLHHNRRRRAHLMAGSPLQEGSFALALARLQGAGIDKEALQTFLSRALISPVLTAHPTEVQRKSILDRQLETAELLNRRDRVALTPEEERDNDESLRRTISSGQTWFWSRSRHMLWHKGATSGNVQQVRAIYYDCDADTLLIQVDAAGPACHTGNVSCFYRAL